MSAAMNPPMDPAWPSRWWWDLTTAQFARLDWSDLVAILPVAAVEQHGPHLPVRVDAAINAGIVARAVALMPDELSALVLPMLPVGKSNEHLSYPGTLSLSHETLARVWIEVAESVHRAGCRRILFLNSHGGQPQVMEIVIRELRVRLGMLAVGCGWSGITRKDDLFSATERRHGIHGGEIETSVMRHLHPDLVAMEHAADFVPYSVELEAQGGLLTPEGAVGFGWMAQDLHPAGVSGNAAAADAARGAELVERAARAVVRLTAEIAAFPLHRLTQGTAFDAG
ncbi:creatininase family protein [uncultured Methylobacterium sp.]|uniref:creatininase family protein n=1 Tax=uncultured Methylobacterium sp. TaxID=157278 RepID=UPI0035CA6467